MILNWRPLTSGPNLLNMQISAHDRASRPYTAVSKKVVVQTEKAYATSSKVIMDSGKSLVVVVFDSLPVEKSYEERLQTPAAFVRKLLSGKSNFRARK